MESCRRETRRASQSGAALPELALSCCLKRDALNPNLVAVAITTGPNNLDPRVRTDDTSQKIAR